jgi:hypothetical protein
MPFSIDLHTHTRHGSSCSYMEPQELVERAVEVGLDGVCITEHNLTWEQEALASLGRDGLVVLGGQEASTQWGEVLVFGTGARLLGPAPIEELRRLVDREGGVLIAAHPFRSYFLPGVELDAREAARNPLFRFVDAVELFNGMSSRREVEFGLEVLRHLGLPAVGGSDSHAPHTVGRCFTRFPREVGSVQELVHQLKSGRFEAVHTLFGMTYPAR